MKMTQGEAILEYLKHHKTISPMEAFSELGITKLATRVSELIRDGYKITKTPTSSKNRYGETVRYMTYALEKKGGNKKC